SSSQRTIVFTSAPEGGEVPEEDQFTFTLRREAREADVAELLRANGLRVLERDRDGIRYRVGVAPGFSAERTAARLSTRWIVYFASPVKSEVPEDREVILQFDKETYGRDAKPGASEKNIVRVLRRERLRVLEDLGGKAFRVAAARDVSGEKLAATLTGLGSVASAVHVGAATGGDVEAAARSAIAYKGRPWSNTEYNMHYHYAYTALVQKGATQAQLKEFARLSSEAPIKGGSFNPWSGD
ncbi:MAG: hypothetical protein V3S11_00845, partial [Elusimicrobiota bacterium]